MEPDFTALQEAAIAWRQQDVCVVAGPGSGKTTVLVERFFQLVETHDFDLRHILAITFTEKAAANMKAKIAAAFAHNPDKQAEVDNAWISTRSSPVRGLMTLITGMPPSSGVITAE